MFKVLKIKTNTEYLLSVHETKIVLPLLSFINFKLNYY